MNEEKNQSYEELLNKSFGELSDVEKKIIEREVDRKKYEAILLMCEKKYEEENYREKTMNTKAGFLLTVLSILLSISVSALSLFFDMKISDFVTISIYIYIIDFILVLSLVLTIISQCIDKRKYFPDIKNFVETLNKNDNYNEFSVSSSTYQAYTHVLNDKHKKNNKCSFILLSAFLLMLFAIFLSLLFIRIVIMKGVN